MSAFQNVTSPGAALQAQVAAELSQPPKGRSVRWSDVWTAWTESTTMRRLVEQREEVFQKQRLFSRPYPDLLSYDLAASHLSQFSATNPIPRNTFVQYHRFCALCDIPVFPITPATLALCVFNRCSIVDVHPQTFKSELERIRQATANVWQADAAYAELMQYEDGIALAEFMRERARIHAKKDDASDSEDHTISSRRHSTRHEHYSSSDGEGTDSEEEKKDKEQEEQAVEPASPDGVEQLTCPGIPQPDSVWPSLDALYLAFFVAVVPVYGIGVAVISRSPTSGQIHCNRSHQQYRTKPGGVCPFRVTFKLDPTQGGWVVNFDVSELRHNHGADSRILTDPSWRPVIKNHMAKEALAAADAGLSAPPSGVHRAPIDAAAAGRGKREASESGSLVDAPLPPPSKRPRQSVLSASPSASPATTSAPLPPAFSTPAQPPPFSTSSLSPASTTSASLVTTFLVSLNPSLSSLTPHLLAASLDSEEALAELTLLDPQWIDLFVETLRLRSEDEGRRPAGSERISVLQARLFAKAVKAVR